MAARISPSKGGKPDKLIRDALMIALKRSHIDADGNKTSKINAIATKLVEQAIEGNTMAAKEIADRVDGKATQPLEHTDPNGGNPFAPLMEMIAANGRPRPGSSC